MVHDKEKAIAIANDALDQLANLRVDAHNGYCVTSEPVLCSLPDDGELQQHVDEYAKACTVCALGSLFLSFVRLFDDVPTHEVKYKSFTVPTRLGQIDIRRALITDRLKTVFDDETLYRIEYAFEGMTGTTFSSEVHDAIRAFRSPFNSHTYASLLRAILENIRDNGDFTIGQEPVEAETLCTV